MVIDEKIQILITFNNGRTWTFNENDLIDDNLSILQQATADNSFSIGGVYSSTLNMTFRIPETIISKNSVNSFNIIGSKIVIYSKYGNENSYILRGIFWITSAERYKNVYTITGSDALIWFDSTTYDDTNSQRISDVLYTKLVECRYTLKDCLNYICDTVQNFLVDKNVSFKANKSNFVLNDTPPYYSGYDCGYYCVTPEYAQASNNNSARDYLSYLAQLCGGFVECQYKFGTELPYISLKTFEDTTCSIDIYEEKCQLDSLEYSNFNIKCIRGYIEVYDGATGSWKLKSTIDNTSNCYYTIDLTDNPFANGNYAYTVRQDGDHNCIALLENLCNALGYQLKYDANDGQGNLTRSINVIPFKLIYHSETRFHLGQAVSIHAKNSIPFNSVITKIEWNFRGGHTLECAGKDNRVLFDSARRTPSVKAKEQAITKANYLADELNKKFQNDMEQQYQNFSSNLTSQWNALQGQIGDLNSITGGTQGDLVDQWNAIQSQIGDINTNINKLKQELKNQGLTIS